MRVSDLYPENPLRGQDVYLIGTGPSLDVFPFEMLRGKVSVLLNDAQKHVPKWVGPVAFSNSLAFLEGCKRPIQVVKGRLKFDPEPERIDNHCPWDHPTYHVFSYRSRKHGDSVDHLDEAAMWLEPDCYWNTYRGSVSIFAAQFAMLCGAKSIGLVGCDCRDFLGFHYAAEKKVKRKVMHDYAAYVRGMQRMIQEGRKRGVPIVQVNPYVGIGTEEEQWHKMKAWK